jgi:hypothetical protein
LKRCSRTPLARARPARADLLHALTSPQDVRAERIRLWFERPDTRDLGELLIDLEEDDFVRAAVVETLRAMEGGTG